MSARKMPKSGMGAKMAGGSPDPSRGRATDDFYATPDAVTRALAIEYADVLRGAAVWEPCAGDGAMMRTLLAEGVGKVVGSDINPQAPGIVKLDVFERTNLPLVQAVITNPPFFLAAEMIEHILGLVNGPPQLLAVVLKATFWHASSRFPLFRRHPPTTIHPLLWRPDFKNLGGPTMEIMWCVWERGNELETAYVPLPHPDPKAAKRGVHVQPVRP